MEQHQTPRFGDGAPVAVRGARNLSVMVTGRLAAQLALLAAVFVIPRVLGPESYGQYAAAMAVAAILQSVSSLGLPLVELRFLAPLWCAPTREDAIRLGSSIWTARLVLSLFAGMGTVAWFGLSKKLGLGFELCLLLGLYCSLRSAHEATRGLFLSLGHVGKMIGFEFLRALLTIPVVTLGFIAFGITGVFAGLPFLYLALLVAAGLLLLRIIPLRVKRFSWSALQPHLGYSLSAFAGDLFNVLQAQFAVFAVAAWVTREEAAFLGLTVQLQVFAQGLFLSARRSLMPIMSELESSGQRERLLQWGEIVLRYGAASACAAAMGWTLLGGQVIEWLLGDAFTAVHRTGAVILLGVVFYCCASACNGLLLIRGRAFVASVNLFSYAAATMIGLWIAVAGESEAVSLRISWVYAFSALIFFVFSYLSLLVLGRMRLPLLRTLILISPLCAIEVASSWEAGVATRLSAVALFLLAYAGLSVGLKLVPIGEIREILALLRRARGRADRPC